jgi:hypothetical protein
MELETKDDEYRYNYHMMPKTVKEIADMTMTISDRPQDMTMLSSIVYCH